VLHPELRDDVESYRHVVVGQDVAVLEADEKGACVYLGEHGCGIYERRPVLCRSFDCRQHYLMLPRQDRDNLVKIGLSSRAVFNAGRARLKTLNQSEREECVAKRREFFE